VCCALQRRDRAGGAGGEGTLRRIITRVSTLANSITRGRTDPGEQAANSHPGTKLYRPVDPSSEKALVPKRVPLVICWSRACKSGHPFVKSFRASIDSAGSRTFGKWPSRSGARQRWCCGLVLLAETRWQGRDHGGSGNAKALPRRVTRSSGSTNAGSGGGRRRDSGVALDHPAVPTG